MNIKLTMHLAQAQKWFTVRENETRKEKNGGGGGAQKTKQKKNRNSVEHQQNLAWDRQENGFPQNFWQHSGPGS